MKLSSLISVVGTLTCATALSATVNFYWDTNCNDYAGSRSLDEAFATVGGPAGSYSAMFITKDNCINSWEILEYRGRGETENPRVWSESEGGQCVSYPNGVQAAWQEVLSSC